MARSEPDGTSLLDLVFGPTAPAEAALESALDALTFDQIRKVEVLMYAGRGELTGPGDRQPPGRSAQHARSFFICVVERGKATRAVLARPRSVARQIERAIV